MKVLALVLFALSTVSADAVSLSGTCALFNAGNSVASQTFNGHPTVSGLCPLGDLYLQVSDFSNFASGFRPVNAATGTILSMYVQPTVVMQDADSSTASSVPSNHYWHTTVASTFSDSQAYIVTGGTGQGKLVLISERHGSGSGAIRSLDISVDAPWMDFTNLFKRSEIPFTFGEAFTLSFSSRVEIDVISTSNAGWGQSISARVTSIQDALGNPIEGAMLSAATVSSPEPSTMLAGFGLLVLIICRRVSVP